MPRTAASSRDFSNKPLGRLESPDNKHVELFPLRLADLQGAVRPKAQDWGISVRYDQGEEGACVGMGCAAYASWWNYRRSRLDTDKLHEARYKFDAFWLYHEAQKIDQWPGEDYDGTEVRAGLEVLRTQGVKALTHPDIVVKIKEYRWATSLEDILNYLAFKGPVVFGLDWYQNFDRPQQHSFPGAKTNSFFIGEGNLGSVRGGHCIIARSYKRDSTGKEWIRLQNSWGYSYPLVWVPAQTVGDLFTQGSLEASVITALDFQYTPDNV